MVINSCVKCFDLQIDGVWQRFTREQKGNLRKAFLNGSLYVNGEAITGCLDCIEEKNLALGSQEGFILSTERRDK